MSFTARGILHNAAVLLAVGIYPKHTPVEEMRISTRLRGKAVLFGKETVSDGKQSKKSRRNRHRPKRFEDAQRRTEAPPPKTGRAFCFLPSNGRKTHGKEIGGMTREYTYHGGERQMFLISRATCSKGTQTETHLEGRRRTRPHRPREDRTEVKAHLKSKGTPEKLSHLKKK